MPEISVIIASRNHAAYLGRCLRSLFSQRNAPSFEIVIFDDASSDETPEILRAFREDICYLRSERNVGLPTALNEAILKSEGKYFVRVDSDDFVSQNFLFALHLVVKDNPEVKAVSCDYILFSENDTSVRRPVVDSSEAPIGCGILFERDAFLETGLYNPKFLANEDKEQRRRFEATHKIERLPIPLYRYRRHDKNMTNNLETMAHFDQMLSE